MLPLHEKCRLPGGLAIELGDVAVLLNIGRAERREPFERNVVTIGQQSLARGRHASGIESTERAKSERRLLGERFEVDRNSFDDPKVIALANVARHAASFLKELMGRFVIDVPFVVLFADKEARPASVV